MSGLKVCIHARLSEGKAGGVQQIVIGLANGFSQLTDGEEEYHFFSYPDSCQRLLPHLKGPCKPLYGAPLGATTRSLKSRAKDLMPGWLYRGILHSPVMNLLPLRPEPSDGTAEKAGMQIIHFPFQTAFITGLPSLYQPHDLQHLHYPEYFSAQEIRNRNRLYQAFCRQASLVVLMSLWGKRDLMEKFKEPSSKVAVVPGGAVLRAYPDPSQAELQTFR